MQKNSLDRANIRPFTNHLFEGINTNFFLKFHVLDTHGVMNRQIEMGSIISEVGRSGEPRREFLQRSNDFDATTPETRARVSFATGCVEHTSSRLSAFFTAFLKRSFTRAICRDLAKALGWIVRGDNDRELFRTVQGSFVT